MRAVASDQIPALPPPRVFAARVRCTRKITRTATIAVTRDRVFRIQPDLVLNNSWSILLILFIFCLAFRRKRKRRTEKRLGGREINRGRNACS